MVKTVVKQALTRKMGNTAREKVPEPQGKIVSRANRSSTLSKTPKAGALPAALHPDGCQAAGLPTGHAMYYTQAHGKMQSKVLPNGKYLC